jgi:hypothetical protein
MRIHSFTRYATLAALVAGLACARNPEPDEADQAAAGRDTTTADTLTGETENPAGYRGMERDTTLVPPEQTPTDTFLQNQGTGQPQDTAGYAGMERVDTTGQAGQQGQTDTTGFGGDTTGAVGGQDTTGMTGADTTGTTGTGTDTTGAGHTGEHKPGGDTTGYGDSQQEQDTTNQ